MLKRVFCLLLALALCVGLFPAQALAESEENAAGTAELKTEGLAVEATSSLGRAFQNTMEEEGVDETSPYRINGVSVESGKVTVSYTSAEDAEVLVAIYEDRSDVLKLITTLRLDVSAEQDTVVGSLPEQTPEYFIVGAYLIRSGSHEPLCEEYTSNYYTQALQEFMSAPLTDFAEDADDRLVILDRGTAADGSEADFLIFREGTVILQETETENHIVKKEDGSYTITGAEASALALRAGDKIGYKMLGDQLDVFLVESIVSVSGDTVVFTENPDVNMETFFETIRIDDMPDPETVEYDTSEMMPGFTVREENDLAKEVAPIYEAASRLEDGEALPESFGDIVVMGGPPGTSSTSVEANICLDINIGAQSMTDLYNGLTQAPDPNRFDVFKEKEFDWSGDVSAEGSFSVGSTLEMEFYLTGSYNYFSVSLSFTKILNLKIQGMLCGEFMIVKVKYPTPLLGVAVTGNLKLILDFSAELSFVASWTSRLSFEYDSDRPEGYRWKNTSSGSDAKPKTSLALKGKLEFGIKESVGIEFISEKLGSVKLSAKATVAAKADLESSILRRLNQGIHSWHDLVYDGQSDADPSLTSASEIHECDNCIDGTVNVKMGIGADFSMLFGVLSTSVDANLFTVNLGDFYYSFDTKDHGWGRCPHRRYRLSLTVIDGLDYTLGDVLSNWFDQDSVEAQNAAKHAIKDVSISVAGKSGQYIQERDLITGADGKVSVFLPVGKYSIKGFNLEYYGEHDFEMYDSARDCYMVLEKMAGASHTDGNITWTFYPNGILNISGTGAIKDYSPENRPPWESEALYTNTIIIQNGITHIGAYSFQYFKHMTEVQLPASLESIGGYAFQNCSDLKQLTLPTSLTAIGKNAFDCCDGLKKAVYNGSETQWDDQVNVDEGNKPLTDHLVFNSAILASGQCGESLFWSLGTTGTLTISGTGDMTEYAKTEDVPWHKYRAKIDTLLIEQGVSSLSSYAFYECAIQELALPNSVKSFGEYCFANCKSLIYVFLQESISTIPAYAFAACRELKTINIPISVTLIDLNAFYGCYSLANATYQGFRDEWVQSVSVEDGNDSLWDALHLVDGDKKFLGMCGDTLRAYRIIDEEDNLHLSIEGHGDMTSIPWQGLAPQIMSVHFDDDTVGSITSICDEAFADCSSLTEIAIPDSVENMGTGVFKGCKSLENLTIPFVGTSRDSTSAGALLQMFSNDKYEGLTSVVVTDAVQLPERAFNPEFYYPSVSVLYYAFPSLRTIILNPEITSIASGAFSSLTGLESIILPEKLQTLSSNIFNNCTALESVQIPNSVTSIDPWAFQNCHALKEITIPDGVTTIGYGAFDRCYSLTQVNMPSDAQSSLTEIQEKAFAHCTRLKALTVPDSVTSMGNLMLEACDDLLSLTMPFVGNGKDGYYDEYALAKMFADIDGMDSAVVRASLQELTITKQTSFPSYAFSNYYITSPSVTRNVTFNKLEKVNLLADVSNTGAWAFCDLTALKEVAIPNTTGVFITACAFKGCSSLESINISNVEVIDQGAFQGCSSLTVFHAQGLNTIKEDAFKDCTALRSVTLPETVTGIENNAFSGCTNLTDVTSPCWSNFNGCPATHVTIPDGVTTIGQYAFDNCTNLTSISIPDGVTSIEIYAFYYCCRLSSIVIPASVTTMENNSFSACTSLRDVISPCWRNYEGCPVTRVKIPEGTVTLPDMAFENCSKLTEVIIPESVTNLGSNAFYGCTGLTGITIPESVTDFGNGTFYGCTGLTGITIPEGVTSIGVCTFSHCTGLTGITIPEGVTSIKNSAFCDCSGLTSITIPEGVTSIEEYAFQNCSGLTSITIPETMTSIESNAFQNCSSLTSITIPNQVEFIGKSVLCDCIGLTSLTVPFIGSSRDESSSVSYFFKGGYRGDAAGIPDALSTVTVTDATAIGRSCFNISYMKNASQSGSVCLDRILLNDGITDIGFAAFTGQSELTEISLPGSLSVIHERAFYNCTGLQEVFFEGTVPEWQEITIESGNDSLYGIPIHCHGGDLVMDPAQSVDAPGEMENAGEILEGGESEGSIPIDPMLEPAPTEEPDSAEEPALTEDLDPEIEPTPTEEPDPVIEPAPTEEPGYIGLASFSGTERSETGSETIYTASFGGLMPGEEYLILAVRSDEERVLLENDNILFVSQQEADENGSLSIRYIKKSNDAAILRCYGMSDKCFTASDKLSVVISQGATDSNAYALAVAYDGVELKENRDYLVSFAYLEDEVVQITVTGIVDYSGSTVILAKASCTEEDTIDGYAVIHMAHEWSNPVWIWSEDQSRAEAVFTCTRDETHSTTRVCEVSAVTENNVTTLTAAVSLGGKQYTDVRKIIHGDLNADEKVDAKDLTVMRNLLLGESQEGLNRADVNGDGKVSILDLVRLRKHLAGQEVVLH